VGFLSFEYLIERFNLLMRLLTKPIKTMAFADYIQRIVRLDKLIQMKATGSPKELANKMGVSERSVYDDIKQLKTDFGCPIAYSRIRKSYYYTKDGEITFGFDRDKT
jgi:biotin operon repressor